MKNNDEHSKSCYNIVLTTFWNLFKIGSSTLKMEFIKNWRLLRLYCSLNNPPPCYSIVCIIVIMLRLIQLFCMCECDCSYCFFFLSFFSFKNSSHCSIYPLTLFLTSHLGYHSQLDIGHWWWEKTNKNLTYQNSIMVAWVLIVNQIHRKFWIEHFKKKKRWIPFQMVTMMLGKMSLG